MFSNLSFSNEIILSYKIKLGFNNFNNFYKRKSHHIKIKMQEIKTLIQDYNLNLQKSKHFALKDNQAN